jgi:class III poly(R)-hydroxyalkanoic acid synthase PhaE subunit
VQSNPAWASLFDKPAPFPGAGQQNEAIEHMLAGAQGYLGMLQNMATAAAGQGLGSAGGFAESLRQSAFPGSFQSSAMHNPLASAMRGFAGHGAQGMEQMMERFAAMAEPLFSALKGGLNAPAFGHLREKQENMQNAARLMIDYQEQSARYDRLMLKVSEQSFSRFQLRLAEREEPGRQIDSVRGLYDLWIDAAEEAYAEIALSEEFREVYGAVVDAQMRLRKHVQGEVEKFCSEFGMPTRSEVDSIGERLQALRREFREEREVGAGNGELAAEVEALRAELGALRSSGTGHELKATPVDSAQVPTAARPAQSKSAKTAKPAKAAIAKKPVNPAKPGKSVRATKAAKAAKRDKTSVSPSSATTIASDPSAPKRGTKKSRSKVASKASKTRRAKRRKSPAGKSAIVEVKSHGKKGGDDRKSFAASIARFARKSKSASTATTRPQGSQKAAKRGGGK